MNSARSTADIITDNIFSAFHLITFMWKFINKGKILMKKII